MYGVQQISVTDILQNVRRSGDIGGAIDTPEDWFRIFAAKVSHDHFDWIADKIMDEGFTVPIQIIETEGEYDTYWEIGNGHHRLCVAILAGLDTIPVILMDDWGWNDDSHDRDQRPTNNPSFDYWGMLTENMEGVHVGDEHNRTWRDQYGYVADNESDHADCDCGDCLPQECYGCSAIEGIDNHRMACPERGFSIVDCVECGYGAHYRGHAMECDAYRENVYENALSEHILIHGGLPAGMWHPAGVLVEAYDEHAMWLRDEEIRAAKAEWQRQIEALRAAVNRNVGDYAIAHYAEAAHLAFEVYAAL